MTAGDWIAAGVIVVFAVLGSLGLLTWLFRLAAGAAMGVAVLVFVSMSSSPPLESARRSVNEGQLVPAVTDRIRQAQATADRIANPPAPPKPQPPRIVIVTGKN